MKVIKKDGILQDFDSHKISTSIMNSALDSEAILNESDVNILAKDITVEIEEIRKDSSPTSSYEITGCIIAVLQRDGFENIIKSYVNYKNK